MVRPLTGQQQAVYDFIRDKIVSRGYGPTVREIGEHMQIKSPNGVMCHLRALEQKGMIIRKANKSRAIELTDPPSQSQPLTVQQHGYIRQSTCSFLTNPGPELDLGQLIEGDQKMALLVHDDSLIDACIRRGDVVIVEKRPFAQNGQLAVVQLMNPTGGFINLMRYVFQEDGQIRLQAASRSVPPTMVKQVDLVGVVVGVVRQLS